MSMAIAGAAERTLIDLKTQGKAADFSAYEFTRPVRAGADLPGACQAGETFFWTGATDGQPLRVCVSGAWSVIGGGSGTSGTLGGNAVETGAANAHGQFYAYDPVSGNLKLFHFGPLLSISGTQVDVATEAVPLFAQGDSVPGSCEKVGLFFIQTSGPEGGKLHYCNGNTYEAVTSPDALRDPGQTGLLKRTAPRTTVAAAAGVDYYAPGTGISASDLPLPTAASGGTVRAKSCAAGEFVASIGTDGVPVCTAPPPASLQVGASLSLNAGVVEFDPTDPRVVWLRDEFGGGNAGGELGWGTGNVGAAPTVGRTAASTWPNLGLVRITTTSTAGQGGVYFLPGSSGDNLLSSAFGASSSAWKIVFVFRLNQQTNVRFRVGAANTLTSAEPANAFGVRFDTAGTQCGGASGANFEFIIAQSSGGTACLDSGVAADGGFHTLTLRRDATLQQKLWFQLDNGAERSACSSGCDMAATPNSAVMYYPIAEIVTGEAAQKSLDLDFFAFSSMVSGTANRRNQ
jgi:hypothetical protein